MSPFLLTGTVPVHNGASQNAAMPASAALHKKETVNATSMKVSFI